MEFTDVGYAYLTPVLLVLLLLANKRYTAYYKSILMAANVCLLFFVISACREYYRLYQMAKSFGFNVSFEGMLKLASTNLPFAVRTMVVLLLPLCFLSKQLSSNIFLTIIMTGLLWWDVASAALTHQAIQLPGSNYSPLLFQIPRFFCLLISMYSFLWLLKRLAVNSN